MTAIGQKSSSTPPTNGLKVAVGELVEGMFVTEVDRPWRETPFPPEGFHIRTLSDLEKVRVLCKFVYIDVNRGRSPRPANRQHLTILSTARMNAPASLAVAVRHGSYETSRSIKQEIDSAVTAFERLTQIFNQALAAASEDREVNIKALNQGLAAVRDSILRNPDALVWHLNSRQEQVGDYIHCLRATVWVLVLARHIGMDKEEMLVLSLGTLLADIGMVRLPTGFVSRLGPFGRREYLLYRQHVQLGLELLQKFRDLDPQVVAIVRSHHERHDGRGFPRQIKGGQIPALARMAGLAYRYDRLLHPGRKTTISPATAAGRLFKQRDLHFPEQLVYEFLQAVGMYPTGTMVELASREIALVLEQNPSEKRLPRVVIITDATKNILKKPQMLSLRDEPESSPRRVITRSVSTGNYFIAPGNLGDHIFGKRITLGKLGIRF